MKSNFNIFKNKKGDIASLIYVVAIIFAIGFVFVMVNTMNNKLFTAIENNLNSSDTLNNSQALPAIQKIHEVDNSAWDYAFLAIYFALMAGLVFTAYQTKTSIAFFWFYIIMSLLVLVIGVMLSNAWQTASDNAEFASTIQRFPITNLLLGSYAPLIITAFIMLTVIVLFGKTPDNAGGGIG